MPPAPVTCSSEAKTVPSSKGNYSPAAQCQNLVFQFLDRYYGIYDCEDRKTLLGAYHEKALFSMIAVKLTSSKSSDCRLHEYFTESRNLLRIVGSSDRDKLLKQGGDNIVSALATLPQTYHHRKSFVVDISLVSPFLMSFTVSGVFKEVGNDNSNNPMRSFSRSFTVTPQEQGFVVCNEIFCITNASARQVSAFEPSTSPSPTPLDCKVIENKQHLIATSFSQVTGMNLEFSVRCLEDCGWDYGKAAERFTALKDSGQIPHEAFVR